MADEQAARQAADAVGDLVFEGLQPGEPGAQFTGVFELTGQTANGRSAWQVAGGKDQFAFFACDGKWWIYNREGMRAGKDAGWVMSGAAEPGALTPDQVQGGWQVYDGTAWLAAPGLRVRPATAAGKAAAAERAEREEAAARQAADAVGGLVYFEGLQPDEPGAKYTGVFELTGQTANGRPVWQAAGGKGQYAGCTSLLGRCQMHLLKYDVERELK
jgi:hypothetical protein